MNSMNSINNALDLFNFSSNTFFMGISFFTTAEFFTLVFIFNFMQLLIVSVISELIWPSHIFNRQFNIGYNTYRTRTYVEVISKLKKYTIFYKLKNRILVKFK